MGPGSSPEASASCHAAAHLVQALRRDDASGPARRLSGGEDGVPVGRGRRSRRGAAMTAPVCRRAGLRTTRLPRGRSPPSTVAACRRSGGTRDYPGGGRARRPRAEEALVRSGADLVLLMTLGGGVMFTLFAVLAWLTGRRVGGLLLAALAGVDFAFAIALLNRDPRPFRGARPVGSDPVAEVQRARPRRACSGRSTCRGSSRRPGRATISPSRTAQKGTSAPKTSSPSLCVPVRVTTRSARRAGAGGHHDRPAAARRCSASFITFQPASRPTNVGPQPVLDADDFGEERAGEVGRGTRRARRRPDRPRRPKRAREDAGVGGEVQRRLAGVQGVPRPPPALTSTSGSRHRAASPSSGPPARAAASYAGRFVGEGCRWRGARGPCRWSGRGAARWPRPHPGPPRRCRTWSAGRRCTGSPGGRA